MPPDEHFQTTVAGPVRMAQDRQQQAVERAKEEEKRHDRHLWRDLVAFWILGMCNNYGYVVMLSAAHDIIGRFDDHAVSSFFLFLFLCFFI